MAFRVCSLVVDAFGRPRGQHSKALQTVWPQATRQAQPYVALYSVFNCIPSFVQTRPDREHTGHTSSATEAHEKEKKIKQKTPKASGNVI